MITKMKKLTFLVYYKEYEAFLNGVRDLGRQYGVTGQYPSVCPPAGYGKAVAGV